MTTTSNQFQKIPKKKFKTLKFLNFSLKREYFNNDIIKQRKINLKKFQHYERNYPKRCKGTLFSHVRGNPTYSKLPCPWPHFCGWQCRIYSVSSRSNSRVLSPLRCRGNDSRPFWNAIPIKSSRTFYASFPSTMFLVFLNVLRVVWNRLARPWLLGPAKYHGIVERNVGFNQ